MSEPSAVRPLQRRSSGEQVADHLRREIFAGRLAPGERIPQEEIASALGVSRIPVREALVILEREGRVRMELHRGAFVLAMDAESVRDNAEIYGMIYSLVARRAAERATYELDDRLASIAERLALTTRPDEIWRLTEGYLDAVMDVGAAPRLAVLLRGMRTLAVDNLFEVVPDTIEATRTGTLELIAAIRARDPERAAAVQQSMQRRSAEIVVAAFAGRAAVDEQI